MLRTILFYPGVILSIFVTTIALPRANYLKRKGKVDEATEFIHKITHRWAKFIMKISGAKVTVKGLENIPKDQTVVFMANHQSHFDIPLIMSTIDVPKGFIAKKELEKWPGVSTWMKQIRCIFMDRDNLRKSAEAIVQGINIIKSGYSMVIFPEGTRSKGGDTHDFKGGSFKLATKPKVPIVPITINGTYKLLEQNNSKIKAASVEVIIHPAVDVKNLSKEEINVLPETIENIVFSSITK
ncbi:lysophospholipid acyltransferase family protein [Clostridium paraputrificum]|uniref:lysophospholipid acyltransferase family protein n=1 Tax=Clostridium paraputrificum TaxID=29363 RepID=UPI003D3491B0